MVRTCAALLLLAAGAPDRGPVIDHQPLDCVPVGRHPRVVACVNPRGTAQSPRVVFGNPSDGAWYAVAMRSEMPCFVAELPRPTNAINRFVYYVEVDGPAGPVRTSRFEPSVVTRAAMCGGTGAGAVENARVTVTAMSGQPRLPEGFSDAGVSVHWSEVAIGEPRE